MANLWESDGKSEVGIQNRTMKRKKEIHTPPLTGLYVRHLGANLLGTMIVAVLNLFTPMEIFNLEKAFIFAEHGWVIPLFYNSSTLSLIGLLQFFIQQPVSKVIKQGRRKKKIQERLFEKAQRRVLNLPFLLAALNLMMWILIPAALHAIFHFSGDGLDNPPLFIPFRAVMIGLVASTLSFFLVEDYSRKRLIPCFFPRGKLSAVPGTIKIAINRRIKALYMAGTSVPMIILVGTLFFTLPRMEISTISAGEFGREVLIFTMCLCTIFLVIALGLNGLVRKSIGNPLRRILDVVRSVRHADFTKRVRVCSNDEIGILGDAINEMTEGLKERNQMRRSLDLAREVQQSLMPKTDPKVPGLDIAGKSIYCEKTGGDYFDYLNLDEQESGKISVVVGDVCGHGLPSALLMTTARALIRQRTAMDGTIADIVSDVNRQLVLDVDESCSFMTLLYITVDSANRSLNWVRAGHEPAIFYDPSNDAFEELVGSGSALGMNGASRFEENEKAGLKRGQIVVVGTDGIWETHNSSGEMLGKDAVCEIIRHHASAGANEILNAIIDFQQCFLNGIPPEDDVTLVVIKIESNS